MASHLIQSGESVDKCFTAYRGLDSTLTTILLTAVLVFTLAVKPAQASEAKGAAPYLGAIYLLNILTEPTLQTPCMLAGATYFFQADWRSYSDPDYQMSTSFNCIFGKDGSANCASYTCSWSLQSSSFQLDCESGSYHVIYSGTTSLPDCDIKGTIQRIDSPDYYGTFTASNLN